MDAIDELRNEDNFDQLVRQGIDAAKSGERDRARSLLLEATQLGIADARPWIWLSATTADVNEQRKYLEYAVATEPGNAAARRGLMILNKKLDVEKELPEGAGVEPTPTQEPEDVQAQAIVCPNCGAALSYDLLAEKLACQHCGYAEAGEKQPAGDEVEQPVDFVLPTSQGHRWADTQERVSCDKCGAVVLLPAGQTAGKCAFCGSNQLVLSAYNKELIDPQAIGLVKIDAESAARRARKWLGKGFFAPTGILSRFKEIEFRLGYYPFWSFDGTLEIIWRCEINLGSSNRSQWVWRSGIETEFFNDALVPGVRFLDDRYFAQVEPFLLKNLVPFDPKYLVDCVAFTYTRSMSDAILLAREKVVKLFKGKLSTRIEPGHQKRNLDTGATKWSGQTYKLVLLPVWVGSYTYQGKEYQVLVNGQTGKVGGDKPRDNVKVYVIAGEVGLILLIAGIMLLFLLIYGGTLFG